MQTQETTEKASEIRFSEIDADLREITWHVRRVGGVPRKTIDKRTVYPHRIVLERILCRPLSDFEEPLRENGDKLDCRRENLSLRIFASTDADGYPYEWIVENGKRIRYRAHRFVMERHLGRKLDPSEVVHQHAILQEVA